MIKKYENIYDKVFHYVVNRLEVISDLNAIPDEVVKRFPTFIAFFKVDNEMQYELIYQIVRGISLSREFYRHCKCSKTQLEKKDE